MKSNFRIFADPLFLMFLALNLYLVTVIVGAIRSSSYLLVASLVVTFTVNSLICLWRVRQLHKPRKELANPTDLPFYISVIVVSSTVVLYGSFTHQIIFSVIGMLLIPAAFYVWERGVKKRHKDENIND